MPPHHHPSCVLKQLMAQWGASVCHREMRILKLASKKEALGPCPLAHVQPRAGRLVVSQEEHLACALGGETVAGAGGRGSQGHRAPRGRAERSQGAPRYTRSSHLGPRPNQPGSWGHTRLRPPRWPALAGAPGAGRGVCAGAAQCAHMVPRASPHTCLQLCTAPWGKHSPAGCLAAASLSLCGCRVTWAPETQPGSQRGVTMAQGIMSQNVHGHGIHLLERGSRHIFVGGVAPAGMSLCLFLSE